MSDLYVICKPQRGKKKGKGVGIFYGGRVDPTRHNVDRLLLLSYQSTDKVISS